MTWPRHLPDGRLVPFVADLMRGRRELEHLHDRGLDLGHFTDVETAELGASLPTTPPPDDDELARVLALVRERNQAMRMGLDQSPAAAPETGTTAASEKLAPEFREQFQPRAPHQPGASPPGDHVQNKDLDPITHYLATVPDEDEDWS